MIVKYGKSYGEIGKLKKSFLEENEQLLEEREAVGEIYRRQPLRKACKLCGHPLNTGNEKKFVSHKIEYKICSFCSHVNGIYDDTIEFSNVVYREQDYGKTYSEKDKQAYQSRVDLIYRPKVLFLKEVLGDVGSILEIGAGSGYFNIAATDEGYDIRGIEISERQVEFANHMNGRQIIECVPAEEMVDAIRHTKREVIAAIGVLEHIYNMQDVLTAIQNNRNIKYLYFSVPLLSFSVFFEMVFQDGFNRHLGGAHTHLFTFDSIKYMNEKFGFEVVGKWVFGTDMADLYRFMLLRLQKEGVGGGIIDVFKNNYAKCLDSLQKIIDESEFASEVHMIVKVLHE